MIDLLLIAGGLVGAYITKNRRWLILTLIGVLWFLYDVFAIAFAIAQRG